MIFIKPIVDIPSPIVVFCLEAMLQKRAFWMWVSTLMWKQIRKISSVLSTRPSAVFALIHSIMIAARPATPASPLAATVIIGIAPPEDVADEATDEAADPAEFVALSMREEIEAPTEDADASAEEPAPEAAEEADAASEERDAATDEAEAFAPEAADEALPLALDAPEAALPLAPDAPEAALPEAPLA